MKPPTQKEGQIADFEELTEIHLLKTCLGSAELQLFVVPLPNLPTWPKLYVRKPCGQLATPWSVGLVVQLFWCSFATFSFWWRKLGVDGS